MRKYRRYRSDSEALQTGAQHFSPLCVHPNAAGETGDFLGGQGIPGCRNPHERHQSHIRHAMTGISRRFSVKAPEKIGASIV
jgi:hypothetical protein